MSKQNIRKESQSGIYYGKGGSPRYLVENKGWYERPAAVKYFFQAIRKDDQAAVIASDLRAFNDLKEWEAKNPRRVAEYAKMAQVQIQPIRIILD